MYAFFRHSTLISRAFIESLFVSRLGVHRVLISALGKSENNRCPSGTSLVGKRTWAADAAKDDERKPLAGLGNLSRTSKYFISQASKCVRLVNRLKKFWGRIDGIKSAVGQLNNGI